MCRVGRAFVHALRIHFRSAFHVVSFLLVVVVLCRESMELFHTVTKTEVDSHELWLALAGAADSLHSFITDFAEFFSSEE
jgi:hypothetical protein